MRLEGRTTLYERLERVAERNLDAPALTFLDAHLNPTCYTYRCLIDRSSAIAKALAIEIRELRSPIGILLQSQEAQVLHYLATLSLGHVPAILTPPNRKLNLAYFIENTRAVLARCGFGALISDLAVADLSMT